MRDIDNKQDASSGAIHEVRELIRCKSPDNTICIAENFSKALLDNTTAIICIWDLDGTLVKFNSFGQKLTGFSEEELIGDKWQSKLFNSSSLEEKLSIFQQLKNGIIPDIHEMPILTREGNSIDVVWTNSIIFDNSNRPYLGVSIGADTTDIKKAHRIIQQMELYDCDTGLPNRRLLIKELNSELRNAEVNHSKLAVLFIDLDNLNGFNETYGYSAGDEIIKTVANSLCRNTKDGKLVARLDSDEFIIIVPDIDSIHEIIDHSQSIIEAASTPLHVNEKIIYPSISIGIATYPEDGLDAQTLIKNANIALSNAKIDGKKQIRLYNSFMEEDFRDKLEIENDLRSALNNKEFLLYYQPQVDIKTGEVVGMEALIRWKHPSKGFIPPAKFIPIAEETGLIYEIGNWVLRNACAQNKMWHDKGYKKIKFSVNLSSKQFERFDFVKRVHKKIEDTGINPEWIELEITESIAMRDFNYTIETIMKLKELNISFALDDFGTGYSSLNYLNKLPVDKLKIDKSFLHNIVPGSNEEYIAKSIIGLAAHMKLTVVAEGAETEAQVAFLREQQCPIVQGYYYSKPLPAEEFENLLISGAKFSI